MTAVHEGVVAQPPPSQVEPEPERDTGHLAQLVCAWTMPLFAGLFFLGFLVFARFIPPPPPSDSPAQVAARFQHHTNDIRIGMILCLYAVVLLVPWAASVAAYLKKVSSTSPALIYTQLAGITMGSLTGLLCMVSWALAAFRPHSYSPETISVFNDVAWIMFVWTISTFSLWEIALAVAILLDRTPDPAFPRWSAYLSLLIMVLSYSSGATIFFHHGPFAWNGLFAFWIPLSTFFILMLVLHVQMLSGMKRRRSAGAVRRPDPASA